MHFLYYPMDTICEKYPLENAMLNLLYSHLEDCSTPQYFCFAVRCEVCGEFWYSSSIPFSKAKQATEDLEKKELYDAIYQREKRQARLTAGKEARERFSQCPICRRLVCDSCFLICEEIDLCRECAARMKECGEPVAP